MKTEAKMKRRAILAQIDVLEKERCEECGGEYATKITMCQCDAAVGIRRLGEEYEAIATSS